MTEWSIDKLGPYVIESLLGRGGMGSVFAARHELTGERAAVKVLAPLLAVDPSFRDRFAAEIESLKTLNHPSIVKLHGFGEHDGHLYYVMELIEGTNLEQELSAGRRFSWREATKIGIDVAKALKHAHDHGIIHRDLKPGNLLLDKTDHVKLTDFGIAKLFGATNVTSSGNVLGTADFMAPEHAAGEATTSRCDLYSLGCVLYSLLAGRPPFSGKSIAEVVHKVRYEQPDPVTKYAQDIPEELQRIISELLEKDPEDRIRTALSLSNRLQAMLHALSLPTTDRLGFSSDREEKDEAAVQPPPDIANRPTVCLPDPDTLPAAETKLAPATPLRKPAKRDHFTRVEKLDRSWSPSDSRSEFSSALPLLLLLLTVIGGLAGGFWYSAQPPTVDELYRRIESAIDPADPSTAMKARGDVYKFIREFPEDSRAQQVRQYGQDINAYKLEMELSARAKGRKETGSLAPAEELCYYALREHRQGNPEQGVEILKGVIALYGEQSSDSRVNSAVRVARNLLETWQAQISEKSKGHVEMLEVLHQQASELTASDPERARQIWEGTISAYGHRRWAAPFVARANQALDLIHREAAEFARSSADSGMARGVSNQLEDVGKAAGGVSEKNSNGECEIDSEQAVDRLKADSVDRSQGQPEEEQSPITERTDS